MLCIEVDHGFLFGMHRGESGKMIDEYPHEA